LLFRVAAGMDGRLPRRMRDNLSKAGGQLWLRQKSAHNLAKFDGRRPSPFPAMLGSQR